LLAVADLVKAFYGRSVLPLLASVPRATLMLGNDTARGGRFAPHDEK
jgi:hypothetical protein